MKLVDLGIKRKDMHAAEGVPTSPASEKDWENEKEYPEVSLRGPHAEMMGAEDLKEGDVVEQTVRWRVKRHRKTTEAGKTHYEMTLCMERASDCKECDEEKKTDGVDDGDGADDDDGESPALAYLHKRAAKSAD